MNEEETTMCLECGSQVYGRKGRKFCSEECKNRFHNRESRQWRKVCNRTVSALMKNHEILDCLIKAKKSSISLEDLEMAGFRPEFITGHRKGRCRHTEYSCFEIRYCQSECKIFDIRRTCLP